MEENLPPGFRFHPTDEELINYYLTHKVSDINFTARAVAEVDLNKCEPWDLPAKATMGEKEWYFFSLRDRKYPTGLRTNRATDAGYWKTTGKDKEIFTSGVLVGMKKTLVFYRGRAPRGEKTNWVMHEYRLQTKFVYRPTKEQWVVCRIFQKSCVGKKQLPVPSLSLPSLLESPCNTTLASEPGEIGSLESDCFSNPNPNPNPDPNLNPDFSDLNRLVRSSNYTGFNNNYMGNNNNNPVNMNITWPSLALPASLLNLNFPYTNPNILKALELNTKNSFQLHEERNSCLPPGGFFSGSNFNNNSFAAAVASSSKPINHSRQTPLDLWNELGNYGVNTNPNENPSITNL